MSSDPMDDVDRLFECFKCGVSPPQSAVRERRAHQDKLKKASSRQDVSALSSFASPSSARQKPQKTADLLCMENPGTTMAKAIAFSSGKQLSPVIFYGSPYGVPAKRPYRLLKLLNEIREDLTTQNSLQSREDVWATFPRQDEAIKFAKGHAYAHVFSYQDHLNGQRRFLVSTYAEFWRRYKNMDPKFRHHYEVIQEGLPCHLYFDLEFNKRANDGKNGDEMVDLLISIILDALFDKYSIQGNQEWIIELDSSTEEKFSRHLIIRIPKTAFKDNLHAGAFVAEICSRICSARESDRRLDKLFISKDPSSDEIPCQLFVDTAVYSRNRCFRLFLSSKAGKNSVLLPTGRFKCKSMSEEEMFMASLICNMDTDCKKLLICKMEFDCVKTLCFDSEVNGNFGQHSGSSNELAWHACTKDVPTTYFMGKSPFPTLDAFVESIASIGNVAGRIRSWYWFSEYGLMVYSMSKNRYCERIGRQHKSNHVMYIVDLRRAVYYQKCYDPDCKGYRSPLRPIPGDVFPDTMAVLKSLQMEHPGEMIYNDLHQGYDENNLELSSYSNKNVTDSCMKDGWWLEAIRMADDIESIRTQELVDTKVDDDDSEWWMAVERTASQAEQAQIQR
ncbi:PREDICTED: DNA-directed primase/polymerase protein isoform X3 [Nelumbo nucifera]|uniref:DNA-directed primase/polymerase protein n=1 Tax=Nelumbo nucifera TaxID=4432 RepID=A0A1U8A2T9_NELNU|nr:PREDICTED: DNA-directed primase/polymerase protein isoform X2 [Nelumbo nucifera]XP_010261357.1 PREDICTED: DNA-directed primase/polymerase protein isoform X3 [Nelumbo nucifera]